MTTAFASSARQAIESAEAEAVASRTRTFLAPVYTAATRPVAGAVYAGMLIRVRDAAATQVQMCVQNSGGAWEWVLLATST